ncbi:MAG: hypothetical protein HY319_14685 [Armatimonadetes bacterium]|nr:hypothetical protein [Armatimonadota bacterium]
MNEGKVRKGIAALALVLLIATTFALMTAAVGTLVTERNRKATEAGYDLRCRYAAYSAVQYALHKLNGDPRYDPGEELTDVPLIGDPSITWSLRIYNNYEGSFANPTPNGVTVPSGMVFIEAQGDVAGRPGIWSAGMSSLGWRGDWMFRHAAIGTRQVTLSNGSETNSYRTSAGSMTVKDKDRRGTVLTNSIQPGGLTVDASSVKGYAVIGPMGEPATVITAVNGGEILPTLEPAPSIRVNTGVRRVPRYIPPYNPTSATTVLDYTGGDHTVPPDAYASITADGGTLRFQAGVYYVKDRLTVKGGARVELDPLQNQDNFTSIYVGEKVELLQGSCINETLGKAKVAGGGTPGGPMTLRFFFVGTGVPGFSELELDMDNSQGWFVASGKNLQVKLTNNSTLWGAVKGATATLDGSRIHYDKDLYNLEKPGMMAWSLQGLMTDSGDLPIEDSYEGGE